MNRHIPHPSRTLQTTAPIVSKRAEIPIWPSELIASWSLPISIPSRKRRMQIMTEESQEGTVSLLDRRLISAPMSMPTANEATMMIVSISLQVKFVAPFCDTISEPGERGRRRHAYGCMRRCA